MSSRYLQKAVVACAALSFTAIACAQYIWLDEKGGKQYSDMPPGPSVPASRILKQPTERLQTQASSPSSTDKSDSPESAASAAKSAPTLAERNAEFQKRRMEQAEKEKKAAEEAKRAADKRANCDNARASNRTMESGQRLFTIAPSGGRQYLTAEERAKQLEENNKYLEGCPSGG